MRKFSLITVIAMIMLLALAGTGLAGSVKDGIKLGAIGPFTGAAAAPGMEIFNSIKLAVEERNAKGGIGGVKVELVMGDNAGDAAQGVNVAEKFSSDKKIYGVIGPAMSNITAATLRIFGGADLVQISTAASKSDLTEKGFSTFFRVCARNDAHGPAVANYIAGTLKVKSAYLLNAKDAYSQNLTDEVAKTLKALGVANVWRDTVVSGEKDYSPVLTKVKAQKPELVLFASKPAPDMTVMIRQMRELGIKAIFFGTEGAKDKKEFIGASEGAAEGAYVYHFATDINKIAAAENYVKAFEAKHGSLSGFGPSAYEAANILLDAMTKAAADGDISRKEVRDQVAATKNRPGILGFPITFDKKGDLQGGATYIFQVKGGEFKMISVATGK
jgi:branched-chain amino acid transport system substrate-binding protein